MLIHMLTSHAHYATEKKTKHRKCSQKKNPIQEK